MQDSKTILLHCKIDFLNESLTAFHVIWWKPVEKLPTENHEKMFEMTRHIGAEWCIADEYVEEPPFLNVFMYIDSECWIEMDKSIYDDIMEDYKSTTDGYVDNVLIWDYFAFDTYDEVLDLISEDR